MAVNQEGHLFAGSSEPSGGSVFRSLDNGASWTQVGFSLGRTQIMTLAVDPRGYVFAGSASGFLFRSTDNGDTWKRVYTGELSLWNPPLISNQEGDLFYATRNGVIRSTDRGETWSVFNNELTGREVFSIAINQEGHLFAAIPDHVYRSTDNGLSWTQTRFREAHSFLNLLVGALGVNESGHIYAATSGGVYRSTDGGRRGQK